ncbi:nucleotide-binding alpha-beta plait domain-containing protein [Tanacetum coccineum]|uniref:Nucleotide-binding alpha-beta plait domain-containing protein n=1 Tax=Tanacetum coccineum TaxID=301880 RepID=A0ABQ5J4G4_9ASTR
MGDRRSKEDHVQQVSTSIFVTNFPDHFSFRDLLRVCEDYGKVIDVNIPNRRSKVGTMNHGMKEEKKPALVLDDSCLLQQDFFLSLRGKLKEFGSLSNLKQASNSFYSDGRIAWVDIEGVPLKVWMKNTFARIISKWGELVFEDGKEKSCRYSKRVCIKMTLEENIFESFKIIVQGKVYWVRTKEVSGWSPDFMGVDDNNESDDDSMDEVSNDDNRGLHRNTKLEGESVGN